jgi:hypothetical protein
MGHFSNHTLNLAVSGSGWMILEPRRNFPPFMRGGVESRSNRVGTPVRSIYLLPSAGSLGISSGLCWTVSRRSVPPTYAHLRFQAGCASAQIPTLRGGWYPCICRCDTPGTGCRCCQLCCTSRPLMGDQLPRWGHPKHVLRPQSGAMRMQTSEPCLHCTAMWELQNLPSQ